MQSVVSALGQGKPKAIVSRVAPNYMRSCLKIKIKVRSIIVKILICNIGVLVSFMST